MKCNHLVVIGGLELTLRSCRQEDIGFVYELMRHYLEEPFNRFTSEKWSRKRFKEGFNPERITIVEHEGMPIGFYDLEMGEVAYVHNLHLSGDYRGGVGSELINYIHSEASRGGALTIKAKIFKSNDKMIHFLTRRHKYTIEQDLPQENSVLVKKVLAGD